MKNGTTKLTAVALLLALGPMAVNAQPVSFNGHSYEVVVYGMGADKTWATANTTANGLSFAGATGHLATITSAAEDAFVETLRVASGVSPGEVWIGGIQAAEAGEPGAGWSWVNGEGAISTPQVPLTSYSNWLSGEPNNDCGEECTERHLAIGLGGVANVGWNDEGNLGNIGGYVVEYDDVDLEADADDCQESAGCNLTGGSTIVLPPDGVIDVEAGATITQTTITIDDTDCFRGPSGLEDLVLSDPPFIAGKPLHIPYFLCGSPNFVVIITESDGIDFKDGTIEIENDPQVFFGSSALPCDILITGGESLQPQDVVVWQPTDRNEVLEKRALELTDDCGSSRGRLKKLSYLAVGMHIQTRMSGVPTPDTPSNAEFIEGEFISLTLDKTKILQRATQNAKFVLSKTDRKKLYGMVKTIRKKIGKGDYGDASVAAASYLYYLENEATFEITSGGFNHFGNLRMRIGNIIFMLDVKVIPFAP